MKLLVTGGAGFIGSNFVRYWLNTHSKDEVIILDKLTYAGHLENLQGIPKNGEFSFVQGDICDAGLVSDVIRGVDVVVHFAAETHVDRSIVGQGEFLRTNVWGTYVLLEEARKSSIKLLHHVSTDEVFGSLPLDRPDVKFSETSPYNPHSLYSASKASSDHLVRSYHDTYGLPVTITNTSNNYGPWQDPEKLIPRFVTNLLTGQKVPLMGKGENVRDWIYVDDHCRAIQMVIEAAIYDESLIGETFCVGGNSERTNLNITQEILKLLGKDNSFIEPIADRLGHDKRYAIDTAKIKKVLGWEPQGDFEYLLSKTVEWYKNNERWWKPLKEGRPAIDPSVQNELRVKNKKEIE